MKHWSKDDIMSVLESLLLSSDKPLKMSDFLSCMGENLKAEDIKKSLTALQGMYEKKNRGMYLRQAAGGYRLATKDENKEFVQCLKKARPFRLSKASLEVLAIVAYQQPCTRAEIHQIRRMDSGHVLKKLMERNLIAFAGASSQPGRPMMYKTTSKFLEVYGLQNLKGLPSLEEIKDEFAPEDDKTLSFQLSSISADES